MELKWTSKALSDLARLYDFLVLASKPAAARTVQSLTQAPVILLTHPRMGEQLFQFRVGSLAAAACHGLELPL